MTAAAAPASVPAVLDRMRAVAGGRDGVARFAHLYLEVTEGVRAELAASAFANPAFLERLDVVFADLFFAACDRPPPAWAPLFEARSRRGIAPLQFALAGMNAHINRDLPVALVATARELGVELRSGSPEHADFERVNGLLRTVEARVKREYLTGLLGLLDRLSRRLDDVVAMWDVERAREAAWTNGLALWALRDQAALSAEFLTTLDRMVGLAGRGLLVPAGSWLRRIL